MQVQAAVCYIHEENQAVQTVRYAEFLSRIVPCEEASLRANPIWEDFMLKVYRIPDMPLDPDKSIGTTDFGPWDTAINPTNPVVFKILSEFKKKKNRDIPYSFWSWLLDIGELTHQHLRWAVTEVLAAIDHGEPESQILWQANEVMRLNDELREIYFMDTSLR